MTTASRAATAILGVLGAFMSLVCTAQPSVASDGDWPMVARDYANSRYSALEDINAANVRNLKLVFSHPTGVSRGHEAAPIVAGGTMFVVTPYPNVVLAFDLTQPGAPLKWTFQPKPSPASQGQACCDVVNRGAAYADGRVFFNALDGQTFALDARNGRELWRSKLADTDNGETLTAAPLVVKGKVLVGNSGSENGARGWLAALDAMSGKILWRAYTTGPDRDVLIGKNFKPFYDTDRGTNLGVSTWPADGWKIGGGVVSGFISYDATLDLIFHGTANPAPWNPYQRPGDNKWTSGIFARDPDTGEARWFYQTSPHDLFAYGGENENVLIDIDAGGVSRKAIVHPDRNGYLYVIDRATGEVLSATAYVHITTSTGVDLRTGRIEYESRTRPQLDKVVRDICPASPGGKNWQPSAYSPRTRLLYLPHLNLCQETEVLQTSYIPGTPYIGARTRIQRGLGANRGELSAWDPVLAKPVWTIKEDLPLWSGALATAGDLVFYGTLDGLFKAIDARTGAALWEFKTSSGIVGQPVAYRGPNGKEYIAVLSGIGGWAGAVVSGDLDTRDATAALGFANVLPDLKLRTRKGGMLYVFGLP